MKKFRRSEKRRSEKASGRCVVGIHAVQELLAVRPRAIERFWLREKYAEHPSLNALFEAAERLNVRVQTQPVGALDKIASSHQGVIAFSSEDPEVDWQSLKEAEVATLVALDEVTDPHNLGAVLRTSWLMDVKAILIAERRSAGHSPAVSKVAQGAVEHVPIVVESSFSQKLEELKRWGFWILGLGAEAPQSLYTFDIPAKVVWVLGSEGDGVRKSVAGACDDFVSLPQTVAHASYNVSVAAALALGETHRQRLGLAQK